MFNLVPVRLKTHVDKKLFHRTTHGIASRTKWREPGRQSPGSCKITYCCQDSFSLVKYCLNVIISSGPPQNELFCISMHILILGGWAVKHIFTMSVLSNLDAVF
jgi:hypothetical protein